MGFVKGFEKFADIKASATKGILDTAKSFLGKAKQVGAGAYEGLKASGNAPLKQHLNPMNAYRTLSGAAKGQGGLGKAMSNAAGRAAMGEALGKAAPGIAATGAYAYGAKKLYDKTLGSEPTKELSQYGQY